MPRFNKYNVKDLKEVIYNSYIHDAKLESIRYESEKNCLIVETVNLFFGSRINLTFCNVGSLLAIRGNDFGSRETIISLTVEDDFSIFQKNIPKYGDSTSNSLYLLFQMFSGDELHIVSREVIIENVR